MTLYEFNSLSDNEKAQAIWAGAFLLSRDAADLKYSLYSIHDFFVEVTYDPTKNKIVKFQSFKTKRLLEAYLHEIDINP